MGNFIGRLKVTDGTQENTVSFFCTNNGISLNDWKPKTNPAKGGGIWASSQFADGRQMVQRQWDNAIDSFDVDISGANMDLTIESFQKLLRLLILAGTYWMSDSQLGAAPPANPFWVEALGSCETNPRYAYIYDGNIPELINPNDSPFSDTPSVADQLTVLIEHGVWRDQPPGQTVCLPTSSYREAFGGDTIIEYTGAAADTVMADVSTTTINTNSQWNKMGIFPGDQLETGTRFVDVQVAQGANILQAYIKFTAEFDQPSADALSSTIYGELSANASAYSTWANWLARVNTIANEPGIDWSQPIITGESYTYDVTSIVQEIVNQAGWASGNAMAFKQYSPLGSGLYDRIFSANTGAEAKPELHITYAIDDYPYGVYLPVCFNNHAVGYDTNSRIEEVRIYDASTGLWSVNMLYTYNVATNLFPFPLGVGDIVAFGSSCPFGNIILNLDHAGDGTVTYVYKHSTAAAINNTLAPNTVEYTFGLFDGIANSGLMAIMIHRRNAWAKFTAAWPGATPMYYFCAEITNIAVAPASVPAQIDKAVYTVNWPYWRLSGDDVGGDIEALLKFLLVQVTSKDHAGVARGFNHFFLAMRPILRGDQFTPYHGVDFLPSGITFATSGAPGTSILTTGLSPYGKVLQYNTGGPLAKAIIGSWTITGSNIVKQYYGRFRCFLRIFNVTGIAQSAGYSIQVVEQPSGTVLMETTTRYNQFTALATEYSHDILDLGTLFISAPKGYGYTSIKFALSCVVTDVLIKHYIYDLILMPADEESIEITANGELLSEGVAYPGWQLEHDSTLPKDGPTSGVIDAVSDLIYTAQTQCLSAFRTKPRTDSKMFILPLRDGIDQIKGQEGMFDLWLKRVLQYLNMRGGQ